MIPDRSIPNDPAGLRVGRRFFDAFLKESKMDDTDDLLRCVIVVDEALPTGRAANAAAVIALTMGRRKPSLCGADLVDRGGSVHPGLIPIGITVLGAPGSELAGIRAKALSRDLEVVAFPTYGQQTNDYNAFLAAVASCDTEAMTYVGVGVCGARKSVGKIVGKYGLLK
jgi:hypothetical protein